MKKSVVLFFVLITFVIWSTSALAAPYTGADIELDGDQFSAISDYTVSGSFNDGWAPGDIEGSIYTAWDQEWVQYETRLDAGTWNIGLNVTNNGDLGDSWYVNFQVQGSTDGNSFNLTIPASDVEVTNGYFTQTLDVTDDYYYVRYTWLNDKWDPSQDLDANIQINTAFFDDVDTEPVPEPAIMLLFGGGLAGLAAVRRYKVQK